MVRKLHLHQSLEYCHPIEIESSDSSVAGAYDSILNNLDNAPIGTDYLITCSIMHSDEITRAQVKKLSFREPQNDSGYHASIPSGAYLFQQIPFTPQSHTELLPLFMKFISAQTTPTAYIRIYKEKRFETAVQFFIPSV